MDALELTMKSSNLIKRVLNHTVSTGQLVHNNSNEHYATLNTSTLTGNKTEAVNQTEISSTLQIEAANERKENALYHSDIESDYFKECDDCHSSDSDNKTSTDDDCASFNSSLIATSILDDNSTVETLYVQSPDEEFGEVSFFWNRIFAKQI